MNGINRVMIGGNVTKEPDIRFTAQKMKVAKLTVAANYSVRTKDGDGKYEKKAEFIPIVAFGSLADIIEKYVHKGTCAIFDGILRMNEYDNTKTQTHVWSLQVIATKINLCGSSKQENAQEKEKAVNAELMEEAGLLDDDEMVMAASNYAQYGTDVEIPF